MKYSIILACLGNLSDRFSTSGYKDTISRETMFADATRLEGIEGIELISRYDVNRDNVQHIKEWFAENKLLCVSVIPELFADRKWGKGALTSRDKNVRNDAIREIKEAMDLAVALDCDLISVWNGQDGYDYPFQGNFDEARHWLIHGIRECSDHNKKIRIALEYKPNEPRTHSYFARAADTLLIALATERANVGVTLDVGHSLVAGENMAEAAFLLSQYNKLYHLHLNDNYRAVDDDMIVGSIHHVEFLELLHWLKKLNYQGWGSMDQFPYRENGAEALSESIQTLQALERVLERFGKGAIDRLITSGNAVEISRAVRKMLLHE